MSFPVKNSTFLALGGWFLVILMFFGGILVPKAGAATVQPFFFLRDVGESDTGEDVRQLQKLLNTDSTTQVSKTGNGAPGFETTYFGPATKNAVIRFQNKYASEVLRPAGQTAGDGFVGLWTRLKLNEILLKASVAVTPPIVPPVPSSLLPTLGVSSSDSATSSQLSSLSQQAAPVGTTIIFTGSGFSKNNTVNFGTNTIGNVVSSNSTSLSVKIPNTIKVGRYDVSVSSGSKKTNSLPFMVTTPGAVAPSVGKVEPAAIQFGEQIKITGTNFTPTGNIVSTNFGIVRDLRSADGKTITLTLPLPDFLKNVKFGNENLDWPLNVMVVNTNGISKSSPASRVTIQP